MKGEKMKKIVDMEKWREFLEEQTKIIFQYEYLCGFGDALDVVANWLESQPDAEEKHGKWNFAIGYDINKKVQCQNCFKMAYEPTLYCPNCGAKMDLGEEE